MAGEGTQPRPTMQGRPANDRLDSWKEIASYLKKDVRTVQRWEKSMGLPVHRLAQGKSGTVFAYKSDLDVWWQESQSRLDINSRADPLRPHAFLFVLLIMAVAVALMVFWPQIHERVWPHRTTKFTLAVRPFKNLSGDPTRDFVTDGLTEEMIAWLGQLHPDEIGVIRLSPAYASSDLDRIGKEVHADYVLEGAVRISGQRVAITAQLLQVSDHTLVWGEPYDRDLKDVLRVQAEVGGAIASGVLHKVPHTQPLTRQVNDDAYLAYLEGREAYPAYLEGRYFSRRRYVSSKSTDEALAKAITLFRRSIEIDPTFAPSYAGLADCYMLLGSAPYSILTPQEAFPQAEASARKALELDSTLAEAHVLLGYSQLVYERDFPEARKQFERALQLRPEYANAHQFYGYYLTVMGKLDEAIAERRKAVELDPLSPVQHSALGEAYYLARQFTGSIEQNDKALELDPTYGIALVNIGRAYEQMGMHPEAHDAYQKLLTAAPDDPAILALVAHESAVAGDKADANRTLAKLTKMSAKKYVPAVYFALVYIGLNRKDDAFRWLDKANDERCEYLMYLGSEPLADPLRGDPRFTHLLSRIGLQSAITHAALRTPQR